MSRKNNRTVKTSHSAIFKYWKNKAITKDGDIIFDGTNADIDSIPVIYDHGEPECWACRKAIEEVYEYKTYEELLKTDVAKIWNFAKVKENLNKCHIIPDSAGGADSPENLFLLCERCHVESPDTENPKNFLKWVYKRRQKEKSLNGFIMSELVQEFLDDCKEKRKNPETMKPEMARPYMHGNRYAQSTITMALADTCDNI